MILENALILPGNIGALKMNCSKKKCKHVRLVITDISSTLATQKRQNVAEAPPADEMQPKFSRMGKS